MTLTKLYAKHGYRARNIMTGLLFVAVCAVLLAVANALNPDAPGKNKADAGTTMTVIEDTVRGNSLNKFEYTGNWVRCGGCQPPTSNSSFYYATAVGNKVTLRFNGTQVKLYGIKESVGGMASVTVDGVASGTIDVYSATKKADKIYESPVLAAGNHTIVLTILSQKNAQSANRVLSIDKGEILLTVPDPLPNAVVYGKTDTFGNLGSALPAGQTLKTQSVDGWGFSPGQSAFFSALTPNGEVVIGTNPQTDNQAYATADHMSVGVFNPVRNTFRNLVIPTSTGKNAVTNPFHQTGGASVDTILPVNVAGQSRLAFISAVNYHGWDTAENGEYPALGYLDTTSGSLTYNQGLSKSAGQISNNGGLSEAACPKNGNIFGQQVANCRGLAEMDLLPLSQKFAVSQYFPDVAGGQASGRIVVMNTDGSIAASYTYPNIPNGTGGFLTVNPREIIADPTSSGNLDYFSVIFDVADGAVQSLFPIQEFSYNRVTNQITPVSKPVLSGQKDAKGQPYRYETARYDSLGNLWLTQAVTGSLDGGPIVVYNKTNGTRKLQNSCAAAQPWSGAGWATICAPDRTAANTGQYGQTRSLVQDPQSKTMFAATLSGYLMRVKQTGSGSSLALTTLPAVNIGLDQLVDRNVDHVGIRKGVVDTKNRALYLPVIQTANPADCPTWPGTTPCAPQSLDQWLYRFDLNALAQ